MVDEGFVGKEGLKGWRGDVDRRGDGGGSHGNFRGRLRNLN